MAKILILHGPNLNLLGTREPKHYGNMRLEDINNLLIGQGMELCHSVLCFQSNAEHQLVDRIQQALHEKIDFILINPAAFTHISIFSFNITQKWAFLSTKREVSWIQEK